MTAGGSEGSVGSSDGSIEMVMVGVGTCATSVGGGGGLVTLIQPATATDMASRTARLNTDKTGPFPSCSPTDCSRAKISQCRNLCRSSDVIGSRQQIRLALGSPPELASDTLKAG